MVRAPARQKGGGFDRNLWNAKAIHDSIGYIEANPVRSRLVAAPEEWKWSSAYARVHSKEIVPDTFALPVVLKNPQAQRIGRVVTLLCPPPGSFYKLSFDEVDCY
jgi:hypothetical protein